MRNGYTSPLHFLIHVMYIDVFILMHTRKIIDIPKDLMLKQNQIISVKHARLHKTKRINCWIYQNAHPSSLEIFHVPVN